MFVVVKHTVQDPAAFAERGQSLTASPPAGLIPHQFLPDGEGGEAVCLWEAGSLDQVSDYIDTTLGDASSQAYFVVNETYAQGLPAHQLA